MRLITPMTDHRGRTSFAVWEYDETRPRNLGAEDPRARFYVKEFVDIFPTRVQAFNAP